MLGGLIPDGQDGANGDSDDEGDQVGDLMGLMQEIKDARTNGNSLTDDERRQNAEQIMVRLAKMMDIGEHFDGEDYDDEDDNVDYDA